MIVLQIQQFHNTNNEYNLKFTAGHVSSAFKCYLHFSPLNQQIEIKLISFAFHLCYAKQLYNATKILTI